MKPTNERGFTLVEVLIAMVIMTVALVGLAAMMAITLRTQMLGRNQTNATRLAQAKLDELVGSVQNWNTAPEIAIGGDLGSDAANYFDVPVNNDGVALGYTRRWVVTAGPVDPGSDAGDLRLVTVRVVPKIADNRTARPVELSTLLRSPLP